MSCVAVHDISPYNTIRMEIMCEWMCVRVMLLETIEIPVSCFIIDFSISQTWRNIRIIPKLMKYARNKMENFHLTLESNRNFVHFSLSPACRRQWMVCVCFFSNDLKAKSQKRKWVNLFASHTYDFFPKSKKPYLFSVLLFLFVVVDSICKVEHAANA